MPLWCPFFFFYYQSSCSCLLWCIWKWGAPAFWQTCIKESNTCQGKAKYWVLKQVVILTHQVFHSSPISSWMFNIPLTAVTRFDACKTYMLMFGSLGCCITEEQDVSLWHKWGHLSIIQSCREDCWHDIARRGPTSISIMCTREHS